MSIIFGSFKYIFKNFWYVLPFALLPGIFLALSVNATGINHYLVAFFTEGRPQIGFLQSFHIWSLFNFTDALHVVYGVCALVSIVVCGALLFPLVEKHMRLGRRTPNGLYASFKTALLPMLLLTLVYFAIYEIFAVVLSSLLFAVSAIPNTAVVYFLSVIVYIALFFALFYVTAAFYLWLPCKLLTGFPVYDAFLYSYRLVAKERAKLVLCFLLFTVIGMAVVSLASLLPAVLFYIVAAVLYALLFLDFCVRMEAAYFKADRLDREDLVHSFKEY